MPIAIAHRPSTNVPVMLREDNDEALLAALRKLDFSPPLDTREAAITWLACLTQPSGWYQNTHEAKSALSRFEIHLDMTAAEITDARAILGLTRADFANAIGIGGNTNTRHKRIFEIETGRAQLNPWATLALRGLIAKKTSDQ